MNVVLQEPVRHQAGGEAEPRAVRPLYVLDPPEAGREGSARPADSRHDSSLDETKGSRGWSRAQQISL